MLTSNEVRTIAFVESNISLEKIQEAHIEIAELQHMVPVFGDLFYTDIKAATDSSNPIELYKLKQMLAKPFAFYVKYHVLPDLHLQDTNKGIQSPFSEHSRSGAVSELNYKRDVVYNMAESFMRSVLKYLESNKDKFSKYLPEENIKRKIRMPGGFVFSKRQPDLDSSDDYYRQNQNA